jgi:hypothetical protein
MVMPERKTGQLPTDINTALKASDCRMIPDEIESRF